MKSQYYIFGIQRSGTNYLQQLITQNFAGSMMQNHQKICWKHSIDVPEKWDQSKATFVIYKNPYTWVESMCYRNRVDWIKTQTKYPATDLHAFDELNVDGFNVVNLARTWKHFHKTWLHSNNLTPPTHLVVKYENLLFDDTREKTLHTIGQTTSWGRRHSNWVNISDGKVGQSPAFNQKSREYYQSQAPAKLTDIQIKAITHEIGANMIRQMGYKVL